MLGIELTQFLLVVVCAILIGISKTGLPALGILVVASMASIFPARESIGIVLPMLITADLVAVIYYRRSVHWKTLFSLLPWVAGGLLAGYILLFTIALSRPIEVILGLIVLSLVALQFIREQKGATWLDTMPKKKGFVGAMGTMAGFTTMIGNAAGPIMSVFLLAVNLPKKIFIGTAAWFFLSVNLIKLPFYSSLEIITLETLTFNLWLIPAILTGTYMGIKFLPYIPQKHFNIIILILAALGGVRLLLA